MHTCANNCTFPRIGDTMYGAKIIGLKPCNDSKYCRREWKGIPCSGNYAQLTENDFGEYICCFSGLHLDKNYKKVN